MKPQRRVLYPHMTNISVTHRPVTYSARVKSGGPPGAGGPTSKRYNSGTRVRGQMGELGASCLTPWVAPPYHLTGTHSAIQCAPAPELARANTMTAVRLQRYSAKSTTVASAAGVNLNSLHLGPSPRPLTVAGRFHAAQRLPASRGTTDTPVSDSRKPKGRRAWVGFRRGAE